MRTILRMGPGSELTLDDETLATVEKQGESNAVIACADRDVSGKMVTTSSKHPPLVISKRKRKYLRKLSGIILVHSLDTFGLVSETVS